MMKILKRQQGFTIVEALVSLALVGMLTLAILGASSVMRRSYERNTKNNYNLLTAKSGLSQIADVLRYASCISIPTSGSATATNPVAVTVNSSITNIYLASVSTGGNSLVIGTTSIAEPFVNALTFTKTSSARIKISMTVKDPSTAKITANPELTMSTTVRMLNVSE